MHKKQAPRRSNQFHMDEASKNTSMCTYIFYIFFIWVFIGAPVGVLLNICPWSHRGHFINIYDMIWYLCIIYDICVLWLTVYSILRCKPIFCTPFLGRRNQAPGLILESQGLVKKLPFPGRCLPLQRCPNPCAPLHIVNNAVSTGGYWWCHCPTLIRAVTSKITPGTRCLLLTRRDRRMRAPPEMKTPAGQETEASLHSRCPPALTSYLNCPNYPYLHLLP